jgi:hypothetical protein
MHPAIHTALIDARETELRSVRRHELPVAEARRPLAVRIALRVRRVATV